MDTGSVIVYIKTEDTYVDIAKDVETRFDTSNYELEISFLEEKQVIGLMKDELDANLMTEFATLKPKTQSYLIDNDDENKNGKDKKKCVIKRKLKFEDQKSCLEATKFENKITQLEKNKLDKDSLRENYKEFIKNNRLILKSLQKFRVEKHNVFTEEVNKIALTDNDDKGMQSIYSIEIYTYEINEEKIHTKKKLRASI